MGLPVRSEDIDRCIFLIRGWRVMSDSDLAEIYRVSTKRLNEQVKRNRDRFPPDFMFRLTSREVQTMRSQSATASRRNARYLPYAFTEHGAVMLANVLNSKIAVQASIQVVRAFLRHRQMLDAHRELAHRLDELEQRYDSQFQEVFSAIRELIDPPVPPRRRIGFVTD